MPHGERRAGSSRTMLVAIGLAVATLAAPPFASDCMAEGRPGSGVRLYLGMWSAHLRNIRRGIDNNWLIGIGWRGLYGGTFVNSYGNRAFAAGIQGGLARGSDAATVVPSLGYRLGLVTGYDGRFVALADKIPVLPLVQVVGSLERGNAGLDLAWAGIVGSLGPRYRL